MTNYGSMYEVWATNESGERCDGKRTGLRAAFALARKLWREYRGAAQISVRLDGVVIEDDICNMILARRKWSCEHRGLPK